MINKLAQINVGDLRGKGPLGLEGGSGIEAPRLLNNVISLTIGILTVIAIVWFLFKLITGGIGLMTAGGDKGRIEAARNNIVNGLIGLVVVVAAIFVIDLVGYLLGIPNILDPSVFILTAW